MYLYTGGFGEPPEPGFILTQKDEAKKDEAHAYYHGDPRGVLQFMNRYSNYS